MNELIEKIKEANKYYAENGENFVSDKLYHSWLNQLKEKDPTNPLLTSLQPTTKIKGEKIKHSSPMLSLDKVYSIDELKKWMEKVSRKKDEKFILMPKFDGIAGRLENGILSTRGDGDEGENITDKLPIINHVDSDYDGELLIRFSTFVEHFFSGKIKKRDGNLYKNPRNSVAGMLANDDITDTLKERVIDFVSYSEWGKEIESSSDISMIIDNFKKEISDYPFDGFVVKLKDEEYGKSLGFTSHHWKHSLALKNDNESRTSVLRDVEFSVAKEYIGMVGIIDPVDFNGANIKRVSLHNLDIVKDFDLRIGDNVVIQRSGDVIPTLVSTTVGENREKIELENCPCCGTKVVIDGPFYKCPDELCSAKIINKIVYCLKTMKIKGISEKTIEKLYLNKQITNFTDLFKLTENDLLNVDGYKEKSAKNFIDALENSKKRDVSHSQLFACLNISGIGESLYKKIFNQVDPTDFSRLLETGDSKEIEKIENLGPERVELLIKNFPERKNILSTLMEIYGDSIKKIDDNPNLKTVCLSGKFPKNKKEYKEYFLEKGYEMVDKVNKDLDLLVIPEGVTSSGKITKAKKLGIEISVFKESDK